MHDNLNDNLNEQIESRLVRLIRRAKAALETHPQVTIQILQGHQGHQGHQAAGRECLRLLLQHGHFAEALQVLWRFDVGSWWILLDWRFDALVIQ